MIEAQGYRSCMNILGLGKGNNRSLLEQACRTSAPRKRRRPDQLHSDQAPDHRGAGGPMPDVPTAQAGTVGRAGCAGGPGAEPAETPARPPGRHLAVQP